MTSRRASACCGSSPGIVTGASRPAAALRGARRSAGGAALGAIVVFWVAATLGGAARRQDRQPDRRVRGDARARRADLARARSRASCPSAAGMANIAIEGKFLLGACVASIAASVAKLLLGPDADPFMLASRVHRRSSSPRSPAAAIGLLLAWLGHPLEGGPDHRRHRDQLRRGRDHQLPVPARAHQEHRAQHAADRGGGAAAAPRRTSRSSARSCSPRRRTSTSRCSLMVAFTYMLFRTRWGLRLRASGEKPSAAGDGRHRRHQRSATGRCSWRA